MNFFKIQQIVSLLPISFLCYFHDDIKNLEVETPILNFTKLRFNHIQLS